MDPATAEVTRADWTRHAGKERWEDLKVKGEARTQMLEAFNVALPALVKLWGETQGLFLNGEDPIYGDFFLGGWISFMSVTLPNEEWEEVKTWQDGWLGKFQHALESTRRLNRRYVVQNHVLCSRSKKPREQR
jgi:hypothetical protein